MHSTIKRLPLNTFATVAATALVLAIAASAQASPVPGAAHLWDASVDDGVDAIWEDLGTSANQDWGLWGPGGENPGGPTWGPVSSALGVTHAYDFDGDDDRARAPPENREGLHNSSFELWFRPDGFPSGNARPIFENGNEPRGLTIGLAGDLLVFVYAAGHETHADLTFDLDIDDNGIDNADFIQVVAVVDDSNDQIRLYVDGGNEQVESVGLESDFTSNNDWGLARNNENGGGQRDSPYSWGGAFDGQVALLREYRTAFTPVEVQQNFAALAGAESSADFDDDLDVDGLDLLTWQRGMGADAGPSGGDADASGLVDGLDLQVWQSQFRPPANTLAAAIAVPEPAAALLGALLTLATVGGSPCGRRRRAAQKSCWGSQKVGRNKLFYPSSRFNLNG